MQSNNILSSELIDIIFDGRNKEYGAYELRRNYSKRIRNALLATGLIAFVTIGSSVLANSTRRSQLIDAHKNDVFLTEVIETPPEQPLPEPEKPAVEEPEVRSEIFTAPKILPDDQVVTPPPAMEDLDSARIDVVKREGIPEDGIEKFPAEQGHKGILEVKHEEPEGPVETVDLDAKFTGNWKQFLERNLVPEVPVSNEAPPGRYPVEVRFVVDLEGHVSDIVATTRHGYGMEEEAVRVIRKSAKWEPAIFNGRPVKAYRRQLITFVVENNE